MLGTRGFASYRTVENKVICRGRGEDSMTMYYEVMPLTLGRGRIIKTDGDFITDFW